MIGLLQRVSEASVTVDGKIMGAIGQGLMVLVSVERDDTEAQADRVFADADDKMNFSMSNVRGGLLLVPQFTLAADTRKGARSNLGRAASPEHGQRLFDYFLVQA